MRHALSTFALALSTAATLVAGTAADASAQSIRATSAQVYETSIVPAQNAYLKSSEGGGILSFSAPDGSLVSKTVCGAFVGRVYKNAYAELTQAVMQGLFDGPTQDANQGLPDSAHWYGAIEGNGGPDWRHSTATKTYSMARARVEFDANDAPVLRIVDTQATVPFLGAVIAAKYTNAAGDTGHTMLSDTARVVATPANAPADTFRTLQVRIWDSTKSVHSAPAGAATADLDTRIGRDAGGGFDEGAGAGSIRLFLSETRAQGGHDILGWSWSTTDDADVYLNTNTGRLITLGFPRF